METSKSLRLWGEKVYISKAERRKQRKQRKSGVKVASADDAPPFAAVANRLEVRLTEHKGMGLFALQDIPKGTYIFDYEGEILSEAEHKSRSIFCVGVMCTYLQLQLTGGCNT